MCSQTTTIYKKEIQEIVNSAHNPSLVIPEESPNENWIYHIYSDGTITHQKGGWAYRQRSEFTEKDPIYGYLSTVIFPCQNYAIVTRDDALQIRELMVRDNIRTLLC